MDIFTIDNMRVVPSVHILMLEPFKTTWEEDKSHNKQDSIAMFTYVEFLCSPSPSNPFREWKPDLRAKHIREEVWGSIDYKHPNETRLITLVDRYMRIIEEESFTHAMYESAMTAAYKLKEFLDTLDPSATNFKTGNPLYKPKEITAAIQDIPETMTSLKKMKSSVLAELKESDNTRTTKDREIGDYER